MCTVLGAATSSPGSDPDLQAFNSYWAKNLSSLSLGSAEGVYRLQLLKI
jgi:hypothetical protein